MADSSESSGFPDMFGPMQCENCQKLLNLLPPDEQVRALRLLACDELEKSMRKNYSRKRKLEEEREKTPEEETEKKLKEEPETQTQALESEAETKKMHAEGQDTQLEVSFEK